jgi:hypothetical protein
MLSGRITGRRSPSGGLCQLDELKTHYRQITLQAPVFKSEKQMMLA